MHLIITNTLFNYDLRYGNMSIKSKLDEHCNFASEAVNGSPACKKYIFDKKYAQVTSTIPCVPRSACHNQYLISSSCVT